MCPTNTGQGLPAGCVAAGIQRERNQKLVVIKLCGFQVQTIKYVLMVKASWILLPVFACCEFWCDPLSIRCAALCRVPVHFSTRTTFRTRVSYTVMFTNSPLRRMLQMEYEQWTFPIDIYSEDGEQFVRLSAVAILADAGTHCDMVVVRSKFHLFCHTISTWNRNCKRIDRESFRHAQMNSILAWAPNESSSVVVVEFCKRICLGPSRWV